MWKRQNRGLGQTPNKTSTHGFNSNLRGHDNNRGRGGGRDNNHRRGGGNLNTGRINSHGDICNRALPEHNVGNRDMHDARYDNNSGQDSFYIDRERRDEFQDTDQSRLFKHPGDGEYHFERRDNVGQEFYDDYNRRGNEYEQNQPEFRHDQYREVDAPQISGYRNEYSNEQVRQHDDGFQRQEYRGQEFDQVQSTDLREKISSGNFRAREFSANVRARQSSANVRARQSSANVRTRVSSANVRPKESAASSRGRAISAKTEHSQSSAIVRRGSSSSTRDTNKSRSSERSRSRHGPNERRNVDKRSNSKQDFDKRNNSSHSSKDSKHDKKEDGNSQRSGNRSKEQSGHLDDKSRHDKPRVNVKKEGQSHSSKTSISLSRNSSTDPKRVNVENKITSTRSSNLQSGKDSSTSTRSNIKKELEVKSVKREANIKKERERKDSNVSTKSRSLDRKQNRASRQKSNHSAERNAEVSKDHGYYHEDDIISILADDDRFDRETKRYVSNEPVTVNVSILDKRNRSRERKNDHDSNLDTDPFQIHAESSSSVFDDVNISSTGNKGREGTFQVPKRVHEHTSSSKRSSSRDKQNRNNTTSRAPRQQSSQVKDSVRNSKVFNKVISGKTSSIYRRRPFSSKTVGSFKKPTLSRTNLKPKVGHMASINRDRSNTTQKFINQEIGRTGAVLKEDREKNVRHDNSSFIRDDKTDFRRETEIYREEDNYRRENVDNFRQTNEEIYRREAVDDLRQTNEEKYRRENVDDLRQVIRVNDEFNRESNIYNVGDDIRGAEQDEGRYAGDNEQYRWDDSHMGDYRTGYDDFRRDGEGSRAVGDTRGNFRRNGEETRAVGENRGDFRRDGEGSRVVGDTRGEFHRDGERFRAVGDTSGDLHRDGEGSRAARDTRGDFRRDGEGARAVGDARREETYWQGEDYERDGYRQDEPLNRDGKFNQNNYKGSVSRYSGERRGIEERNQYKVPRNTRYDRFKKKYFSNRYGNNKRLFGNGGSRRKDDQDKDRSRDRSKGRHQGDASSPVNPDLNLQPMDSNQQVIFIPNTDFGGHPQLLDQYGNVVINPINQELDVHQGETPVPLQFAPPNMTPEVPPGEQLIFIPFNQLTQQQGFSENTVSLPFGTEGKVVGGAHFPNNAPLDRNTSNQEENGKDVAKPAKKPLTNQQRARLRRRLYLKQKQRLEKRVEERLLKKLLGQTNDLNVNARSHSIISKAKPILKKITAPGEGSSHVNKQIRLTRGTNKRADLDDVSDDEENKYDQVSDLEDVTDDENYEAGGKVAKGGVSSGKRPTFRKPGEPRINSSRKRQASKNPSSLNSNNQFMRPQNTDIRKVVDRNYSVNSDKNRRINIVSNKGVRIEKEQDYGRKRASPVTEHTTEKKMRTMDKDKKFEHSDEKQSKSTAQRRERIYEKRPISPLQITVSNERFAKKDTAEQLYPVYKTENESHRNFKENARHDKSIEYSKSHEQYHDSRYQFKDLEKGNDKQTISKTDGRNTGSYERNKKQDIVVQERRDSFNERQKRQDSASHERRDSFNERHKKHDSAIHERRDSFNRKRDSDERNVKNDGKYDSRIVKEDSKIETDKSMFENRRNYSQQPGSPGKDNRKGNNYNKKLDERVDRDHRKDERDSGRSRSNDGHDIDQRKERRETNSYRDNHKKSDDKYRHKQDSDKAKRSYQPSQGRSSSTNKRDRSPDKKLSVHEKLHQNTSQQSQSASHPEQTFQQVQGHFNTSQSQQFAILQHPNVQFLNTNSQNDPSLPPMAINQLPMNMPPVPPSSLGVRPDMSMPPPHVQLMGNSQQIVYQQQPVQQQQQFSQPIQQTVLQPLQQQQLQQLQSQQFQQQPQQFQQQQLQQQQQLPMNSNQQFQGRNTTGMNSAVFQTGIQCMTSSQQNIGGSPIFTIQSNQQNQSQGNQFHQQQQSGMNSGMMQLDPSQSQGQFQNSQSSNQSMPLMSNQQQGTSQQNFQQQISSSPSSYVAGTPQQAMRGVLRSVGPGQSSNSGGVLKTPAIPSLLSTFQNQLKGSQGILKLPQGTLQYASQEQGNNQSNNNMIMGTNATLAKTPTHYEAQAGINKTTGHQNWQDDEEEEDDIPELLCTKCDKVFMCDSVMRKHGMWHNQMESGIIDLRCDNCEQAFMSNGALNRHISEKHSVDSWNCSMCDITFTNSNALSKHMRTTMHRPLGNKFSCSQCKATFKLLKQLILHKTDIHPQGGTPSYSSNIRRY